MPGFKNWASGEILSAADLMKLPQHNYIVKPSDESVTNATVQDDDHLVLAVAANTDYVLDGMLVYSAAQSVGMVYGWSFPTSATMWWNSGNAPLYDAQGTPQISLDARLINEFAQCVGISSGGAGNPFRLMARPYGLLRVAGTAGNIRMRFAQQTLNAGDATVMRAGSWLRITKIS
ncbi:hypothetical protein ACIBI9_04245 [Nonomuraea sp. NPDC050451]|uniref:hypothetical protein n=1 Tax=Nonomuraea sp. NPDC050451 TaxID=3364364 RepID=UPI0037B6EE65